MFGLKKINETTLTKFRSQWPIEKATWLALEMNQNISKDHLESYALEVHHQSNGKKGQINRLQWQNLNNDSFQVKALISGKAILSGDMNCHEKLWCENFLPTLEGSLHHFFKLAHGLLVDCGRRPPTGSQNLQEGQGKEWLRVTLEVLRKALEQVKISRQDSGPEVLEGLFFCGYHPTNNRFTFRLRIFNLDLEMIEDEEHSLRVMVLDKKNRESFAGVEPSLKMVFNNEKAPVIDYLIKILPYVAEGLIPSNGK